MKKSPLLLEPYEDRKWILKEEYVHEINGVNCNYKCHVMKNIL